MHHQPKNINIERVRCNLCGQDNTAQVYQFDRHTVLSPTTSGLDLSGIQIFPALVRCKNCGLVYVNPRWTFPDGGLPYSSEAEEAYFKQTRTSRIIAYDHLIGRIKGFYRGSPLRALDVGCGDGLLLTRCNLAGMDCEGFEISSELVKTLRSKFGEEKIYTGDLGVLHAQGYDIVFLLNVIEHLPDPKSTLKQIYRLLKPRGRILIHAPNWGGLPARLKGQRWHQIEPLSHIYYFSWHSLGNLLKEAGLIVERGFYMKSSSKTKSSLQLILNFIGLHIDNGLGVIASKPAE